MSIPNLHIPGHNSVLVAIPLSMHLSLFPMCNGLLLTGSDELSGSSLNLQATCFASSSTLFSCISQRGLRYNHLRNKTGSFAFDENGVSVNSVAFVPANYIDNYGRVEFT